MSYELTTKGRAGVNAFTLATRGMITSSRIQMIIHVTTSVYHFFKALLVRSFERGAVG